ncbi:hypothetical protein EV586_10486 [Tumebacillus sp. BK434]|nr:hypothetical protein [Tumebacillus sp. BK434]TCP54468.1 hypothetical protein EV586_10486 [Tumebacillus sp. BK434]
MKNQLADLTLEQHQAINRLESDLGLVLIAYDDYRQEDNSGELK